MRIIRRYLIGEVFGIFALSLFIITMLFLSQRIIQLTDWAINRGVGVKEVALLLIYLLPGIMALIIPIVTLFSILLGVGRLSSDNEIVALKAVGVSLYRLSGPALMFAAFAAALALSCSQYLVPRAARESQAVRYRIVRTKTEAAVAERLFTSLLSQVTVYVRDKQPGGELAGIMVAAESWSEDNENEWVGRQFVFARSGRFVHDPVKLVNELWLSDGTLIQEDRKTNRDDFVAFENFRLRLEVGRLRLGEDEQRQALDLFGLRDRVAELAGLPRQNKKQREEFLHLQILFHERLAFPFGCFALCFWALPLGIQPPRAGRARSMIVSVILAGLFYYLMILAKFAALKEWTLPAAAMWTPDVLILLTGLYMLRQKNNERPILVLSFLEDRFWLLYDRIAARKNKT